MNLSSREQGFLIMAVLLTSRVTSGALPPPRRQPPLVTAGLG